MVDERVAIAGWKPETGDGKETISIQLRASSIRKRAMNRHQQNGIAYYTFEALDALPELVHAVTARHGGVSAGPYATLNMGRGLGDEPAAVEENVRRVCAVIGIRREHLVSPRQRHTANVRRVDQLDQGQVCTTATTRW